MTTEINVLEINNLDIYGKNFNGYSIAEYIDKHPELNINAKLLVNHKFSKQKFVAELFKYHSLENFDWKIEEIEKNLGIKNQISISEDALISHPLYQSADILHFHMYHNCSLPIEFLTRIPSDKKIIIDVHDTFWLTDEKIPMLEVFAHADGANKKALDAQRKRVMNSIDAELVVHSKYLLEQIKKSSVTKKLKTTLINFGIDTDIFKPLENRMKLRKKLHINPDEVVLMCRAQREFKGIDYIEKALKIIHSNIPITIIAIGGAKGLLNSVKDNYRIIEPGAIDTEAKLAELYNVADVFLAPSTEESFGFMAAEAMACEKPVIVFEGTALPDTTGAPEIGVVTERDPEALAHAIQDIVDRPEERIKRGKDGRTFVIKNYNKQGYFDNYIHLFKHVAKNKTRKIVAPKSGQAPSNVQKLQDFLSGKNESEIFDFNNSFIQEELRKYNTKLYNEIKADEESHPIVASFKNAARNIRKEFVCLKKKISR